MITDRLEQAIRCADRHEIRQVLVDILTAPDLDDFVTWTEQAPEWMLKAIAPELVIIERPDGSMYLMLVEDNRN